MTNPETLFHNYYDTLTDLVANGDDINPKELIKLSSAFVAALKKYQRTLVSGELRYPVMVYNKFPKKDGTLTVSYTHLTLPTTPYV